eukprot:5015124-Pleurochrysis_carterae.AAC.1
MPSGASLERSCGASTEKDAHGGASKRRQSGVRGSTGAPRRPLQRGPGRGRARRCAYRGPRRPLRASAAPTAA